MPAPKPEGRIGNIIVTSRPDELDLEQVSEAVHGRFWGLMQERIRQMIQGHQALLVQSEDDRAIARAQGSVRALEAVLRLPEELRKEVRAKASH